MRVVAKNRCVRSAGAVCLPPAAVAEQQRAEDDSEDSYQAIENFALVVNFMDPPTWSVFVDACNLPATTQP